MQKFEQFRLQVAGAFGHHVHDLDTDATVQVAGALDGEHAAISRAILIGGADKLDCGYEALIIAGSCDGGTGTLGNQTEFTFAVATAWRTTVVDVLFDAKANPALIIQSLQACNTFWANNSLVSDSERLDKLNQIATYNKAMQAKLGTPQDPTKMLLVVGDKQ